MPLSYDECLSKGLLRRIPPSKEQGKRSFEKAQRWLDEAKIILGSKAFNSSVSAAVGDNRTEAILDNGGTANRHSRPSITGWSRRINKTWRSQRAA